MRVVSTEVFEGFPDAESVNTMTLKGPGSSTQKVIAAFNDVFGA